MAQVIDMDAITGGLRAIASLRCGVDDLFKSLTEGVGGPLVDATTGQSKVKEGDADEEAEKRFINDIQGILDKINLDIKKMETSCEYLSHASINLNLGLLGILAQDPTHERTGLYPAVISCYRWFDRMYDYASHAHHRYTINHLCNRNMQASETLNRMKQPNVYQFPTHKLGNLRSSFSGINMPNNQIDAYLNNMARAVPNLTIEIKRPFGSPTVVIITLDKVAKALVLLHGLIIEWIVVKAINEDFNDENGTSLDIWSESRYEVFRRVSENCNSATLHFSSTVQFDLAVRSWITWFSSFQGLFTKPCRKCDQRLNSDFKLPTWRDFRTAEPFHEDCRL